MSALEEIEAIKQLKYRYLRCVDLKLWEELERTFVPEAESAYDGGRHSFHGAAAIVGFLRRAMEGNLVTRHQVHHPEITLHGPDRASATWYLEDYVINPGAGRGLMPGNASLAGAGFYADEYVKRDGEWRILRTGYERTYAEIRPLPAEGSVQSRWEGRTAP